MNSENKRNSQNLIYIAHSPSHPVQPPTWGKIKKKHIWHAHAIIQLDNRAYNIGI